MLANGRFSNGQEDPTSYWVSPGIAGTGFGSGMFGKFILGKTSSLRTAVIDRAMKVPDLASVASMWVLRERYLIDVGPSTGLNFATILRLTATKFSKKRESTSSMHQNATKIEVKSEPSTPVIATIIADNGENYRSTYFNLSWIDVAFKQHGGLRIFDCWRRVINEFLDRRQKNSTNPTDILDEGKEESKNGQKMVEASVSIAPSDIQASPILIRSDLVAKKHSAATTKWEGDGAEDPIVRGFRECPSPLDTKNKVP